MKFLEYLEEQRSKDVYILVDKSNDNPPQKGDNTYVTSAVSLAQANASIFHKIRTRKNKMDRYILNNKDYYKVITYDAYLNAHVEPEVEDDYSDIPHIKPKPKEQLELFKPKHNPPN